MNTTTYVSATDTAALIRKALKEEFAGLRFSVRTEKYRGGATVFVAWTDGPQEKAVKAVTERFEGNRPDVTGDFMDPVSHDVDGEKVHYGARHIWTERSISEATYNAIEPEVLAALELDAPDYGRLYQVPPLVLDSCPGWHYERATIKEFVRAVANSRAQP